MSADWRTEMHDLHRRFDLIERIIHENQQSMTERLGHGFKSLHGAQEVSRPGPTQVVTGHEEVEVLGKNVRAALKTESDRFLTDLESRLPRELSSLVRQFRLTLWFGALLLFVSLSLNAFFFWQLKTEIINRTPTRMQILMMEIGWRELQKKETGGKP